MSDSETGCQSPEFMKRRDLCIDPKSVASGFIIARWAHHCIFVLKVHRSGCRCAQLAPVKWTLFAELMSPNHVNAAWSA